MMARAASRPLLARRAPTCASECPADTLSIGRLDADDAGRRDQHLLGGQPSAAAVASAISSASAMPVVAGAGVGAAAVDDDRARRAAARVEVLAARRAPARPAPGWW